MKTTIFCIVIILLCFSMKPHRSQGPIPVNYYSQKYCQDEVPNPFKPTKSLKLKYDHFLLICAKTFFPPGVETYSIININDEHIDLIEYDGFYDCSSIAGSPVINQDTLEASIEGTKEFQKKIKRMVKNLDHFRTPEIEKYSLSGICDGVFIRIYYCSGGKCIKRYFDNPWSYFKQDSSIIELNKFIEFDQLIDTTLGKDLWAI